MPGAAPSEPQASAVLKPVPQYRRWFRAEHTARFYWRPHEFLRALTADQGDVVAFDCQGSRCVLVNDPEMIREILMVQQPHFLRPYIFEAPGTAPVFYRGTSVDTEGETHRALRAIAAEAFHGEALGAVVRDVAREAQLVSAGWRAGSNVDILEEMEKLCFSALTRSLLGLEAGARREELWRSFLSAIHVYRRPIGTWSRAWSLFRQWRGVGLERTSTAVGEVDALLWRCIREGSEGSHGILSRIAGSRGVTRSATLDEAKQEIVAVLLAGFDGLSTLLAWTWYRLARHPEAEAKVAGEILSVSPDGKVAPEHIDSLREVKKFLSEVLRLYPPAWSMARVAMEDRRVGEYLIPKGATVFMCCYLTQRDSRFFDEPEAFLPERWNVADGGSRHKFAFFPWGAGLHSCTGEQYSWRFLSTAVAALAARWRPRCLGRRETGFSFPSTAWSPTPTRPLRMILEPRNR